MLLFKISAVYFVNGSDCGFYVCSLVLRERKIVFADEILYCLVNRI